MTGKRRRSKADLIAIGANEQDFVQDESGNWFHKKWSGRIQFHKPQSKAGREETGTRTAIAKASEVDNTLSDKIEDLAQRYAFKHPARLSRKLRAACDDYLVSTHVLPNVGHAQQRFELERLTDTAEAFQQAIRELSADAEGHITWVPKTSEEERPKEKLDARWRQDAWRMARSIARATREALSTSSKSSGGRPPDIAFQQFISDLIEIYESGTGSITGVSRRDDGGLYHGPFFRFANECCGILRLNPSNNALGTAIQRVRQKRKSSKQK